MAQQRVDIEAEDIEAQYEQRLYEAEEAFAAARRALEQATKEYEAHRA